MKETIKTGMLIVIGIFGVLITILAMQTIYGGSWTAISQATAPLIIMIAVLALVVVAIWIKT